MHQQQHHHHNKIIFWVVVAGCFFVVVALWLPSLTTTLFSLTRDVANKTQASGETFSKQLQESKELIGNMVK